jgi:hypothetical protein
MMKRFLTLTAIIDAATGLGLIAVPAIVVRLLLGAEISGASMPLGRVAGAALLALGVACWLARDDRQSRTARGLVVAMLMYNFVATLSSLSPASAWGCTELRCGRQWFFTQ